MIAKQPGRLLLKWKVIYSKKFIKLDVNNMPNLRAFSLLWKFSLLAMCVHCTFSFSCFRLLSPSQQRWRTLTKKGRQSERKGEGRWQWCQCKLETLRYCSQRGRSVQSSAHRRHIAFVQIICHIEDAHEPVSRCVWIFIRIICRHDTTQVMNIGSFWNNGE